MQKTKDIKQEIIKEIQRIFKEKGEITLTLFKRESKFSAWHIFKYFNSWNEAVEQAGLQADYSSKKIEDEKLFMELKRVFEKLTKVSTTLAFQRESKFSLNVYKRRFGKWDDVLLSFRNWLEVNKIDFPYVDQLPYKSRIPQEIERAKTEETATQFKAGWPSVKGVHYGPILNFRGLQHAPINEQGVVYLFGMVSFELGFIIEAIRTGFPDCEGKRLIDEKKGLWERVAIEFEYKSSGFKEGGHDPNKCDLIVCWEHDWADCPIEVLELKTKIKQLEE